MADSLKQEAASAIKKVLNRA